MKRFLLFAIMFFALCLNLSAEAQFAMGETQTDTSLPVTLSSFTTISEDGTVTLLWRTETEVGNVGFSIYRSEEEHGNYVKVAFVSGAGNSGMPIDYQFSDKKAEAGKTYFYYLEDIDIAGEKCKSRIIKAVVPPARFVPGAFRLLQNYPNPFNPETWIPYQLAKNAFVTIRIYNVFGELINTLSLGEKEAGFYINKDEAAYWDGMTGVSEPIASGVYFYNVKAGEFSATRRMLIIK